MLDIEAQVIGHSLTSIAEEMGARLVSAAYSANIKERRDCSAAIFAPSGELVAQAEHMPIHLGSLLGIVEVLLDRFQSGDFEPGDIFVANDPYHGGGEHLSDIAVASGVFVDGALVAYVVNIGHHADGGAGVTTSIYDEGLRIPLIRLMRNGEWCEDVLKLLLLNFRIPSERLGDFRAQIGANALGEARIVELIDRYGLDSIERAIRNQLDYGERRIRAAIAALANGAAEFEDVIDDDGRGAKDLVVHVRVEASGGSLCVDFSGSSAQVSGDINSVYHNTVSLVYYCVKAVLDPDAPANAGFHRAITVRAPIGSIVNSSEPAAVEFRATTSFRIVDVVLGAMAQLLPSRVPAASHGSGTAFSFMGLNERTGRSYYYMEAVAGGSGAMEGLPGMDGTHSHISNSSNLPIEVLEVEYPLRVEEYSLIEGSGGIGRWRGGLGLRRVVTLVGEQAMFLAHMDRVAHSPWGLAGGGPGRSGRLGIVRSGKDLERLPSKVYGVQLSRGDAIVLETPGGGGFGTESIETHSGS